MTAESGNREALLVIDMQKKFYRGTGKRLMDQALPVINSAVAAARARGTPVIWIKHTNKSWGLVEGRPEFELVDQLSPQPSEPVVVKTKGNGFAGTNLDAVLKERGVGRFFVCGYAAEACVHSTYKGGLKMKYGVCKIQNGTASSSGLLLRLFRRIGLQTELKNGEWPCANW